jgi:beta-galactosidase GanA
MNKAIASSTEIGNSSTSPTQSIANWHAKIAEQMAKRFGHNAWVLGWQIDNEYSDISFDPDTKEQFQQWLKARYGTLDNLNARWTTSYWSETFFTWDQIPIQTQYGNPGLLLSWKRFVSETWRSYQKNQMDVIRANSDLRQFITTNTMGGTTVSITTWWNKILTSRHGMTMWAKATWMRPGMALPMT